MILHDSRSAWNMSVMIPSQDSMVLAAFEGSRNHGILWNLALRSTLCLTRRAVFHPGRCHFARLTSLGEVMLRPYPTFLDRYERICTQKHTARQSACSQNDLERPQWRALRAAAAVRRGGETVNKIASEGADL